MAYDQGFLKVTWGFAIENTDEIALTSLNFSHPTDPGFNEVAALAEIDIAVLGALLVTRMGTLLSGGNIRWADYSELRSVRIAAVSAAGVEFDPAKQYDAPSPPQGTVPNIPAQLSLVLSTRSGSSAGSANFGRMYLPHTHLAQVAGSPRATTAALTGFATACQTFIVAVRDDVNAVVTESVLPMIMTQVVGGQSKVIAQIAMGDIVDTQRRRRNALPELYEFRSIS